MKRNLFWRMRALGVVALCLAATTAYAQSSTYRGDYGVLLPGVNSYGCLDPCLGTYTCFSACINTCTGKFTGTARACVTNYSCRNQCYKNPCISICGLYIKCSKYDVSKKGAACFTASGCVASAPSGQE